MVDPQFKKMLEGYGVLTARILYHMPDCKSLLQEFVWQTDDVAPEFPELQKFLRFWDQNLDGPIHSVYVAHRVLIAPAELRRVDGEFVLH